MHMVQFEGYAIFNLVGMAGPDPALMNATGNPFLRQGSRSSAR